jgi:toxin ParE1/3/4
MSLLRYSKRALADLDEIAAYSLDRWGTPQTQRYLDHLQASCLLLSRNPELGRRFHVSRPELRRFEHGSHILLYALRADGITIRRIIHNRRLLEKLLR